MVCRMPLGFILVLPCQFMLLVCDNAHTLQCLEWAIVNTVSIITIDYIQL